MTPALTDSQARLLKAIRTGASLIWRIGEKQPYLRLGHEEVPARTENVLPLGYQGCLERLRDDAAGLWRYTATEKGLTALTAWEASEADGRQG